MHKLKTFSTSGKYLFSSPALRRVSSSAAGNKVLIETNELETLIKEQPEQVSILNATYAMGNMVPRDEHIKGRIPGSIFYDFNRFSDSESSY